VRAINQSRLCTSALEEKSGRERKGKDTRLAESDIDGRYCFVPPAASDPRCEKETEREREKGEVRAADRRLISGSARGNRRRNSASKATRDHYSAFRPLIPKSAGSLWSGRCLAGRNRFLRAMVRLNDLRRAFKERRTVNSRDRAI